MKKIIGIFLLVVLIAPFLGSYVWLQHEKTVVRKKVKKQLIAGLDKKELVLLKFSKENIEKLDWEHSKEFRYQGKMYDVVYSEIAGNIISYWCWLDKEETKLNKLLSDLVTKALGNDPLKQEKEKSLIDFTKTLFYSDPEAWCAFLDNTQIHHHFSYSRMFNAGSISPPSRPPRLS